MKTTQFKQLENELRPFFPIMEQAVDSIINQEISKYPILVVHQHELEVGVSLVNHDNFDWTIHASSLEEFVSRQLIEQNKVDSFRTIYKDSAKFLCLFVISEMGANFIFTPRSKSLN